jgi:hypothetical protein
LQKHIAIPNPIGVEPFCAAFALLLTEAIPMDPRKSFLRIYMWSVEDLLHLTSMRCLTAVLVLGCVLTLSAQDKDERVRTSEPTVVTVRGVQEEVETAAAPEPQRSAAGKVGHGIRTGVAAVGKGVMNFVGWIANVDDDVPSAQERQRKSAGANR